MSHIDEQIDLLLNACEKGNTDIIKTLLNTIQDKSIFSNSQLKRGSPVEVAIRFHNNIIVNLLLVDSRIDTQEVFYWACYYGDQTVVQSLLNTNIPKNFGLRTAAKENHTEIVKLILSVDVNPNVYNDSPLYWACYNNNLEMVFVLMCDIRVDTSFQNNFPIHIASSKGFIEIVRLLLTDTRVDPSGFSTIYWAYAYRHFDIVKLMLTYIDMSKISDPWIIDIAKKIIFGSCNQTMKNIILVFYHTLSTYRKFFKTKCSFMDNFQ